MNTGNTDIALILQQSVGDMFADFFNFLPQLLLAILVFCLGLFIAHLLGKGLEQLLSTIGFDTAFRDSSAGEAIRRSGYKLNLAHFLGFLLKWGVIIITVVTTVRMLGLDQTGAFLDEIVRYLPKIASAVIILLIGGIVAEALQKVVIASARSAGLASATFLGVAARWGVWIFAALAALVELGIAPDLIRIFFTGIMVSLSLALGLAFGLGGREAAGRYIDRLQSEVSHRDHRRDM